MFRITMWTLSFVVATLLCHPIQAARILSVNAESVQPSRAPKGMAWERMEWEDSRAQSTTEDRNRILKDLLEVVFSAEHDSAELKFAMSEVKAIANDDPELRSSAGMMVAHYYLLKQYDLEEAIQYSSLSLSVEKPHPDAFGVRAMLFELVPEKDLLVMSVGEEPDATVRELIRERKPGWNIRAAADYYGKAIDAGCTNDHALMRYVRIKAQGTVASGDKATVQQTAVLVGAMVDDSDPIAGFVRKTILLAVSTDFTDAEIRANWPQHQKILFENADPTYMFEEIQDQILRARISIAENGGTAESYSNVGSLHGYLYWMRERGTIDGQWGATWYRPVENPGMQQYLKHAGKRVPTVLAQAASLLAAHALFSSHRSYQPHDAREDVVRGYLDEAIALGEVEMPWKLAIETAMERDPQASTGIDSVGGVLDLAFEYASDSENAEILSLVQRRVGWTPEVITASDRASKSGNVGVTLALLHAHARGVGAVETKVSIASLRSSLERAARHGDTRATDYVWSAAAQGRVPSWETLALGLMKDRSRRGDSGADQELIRAYEGEYAMAPNPALAQAIHLNRAASGHAGSSKKLVDLHRLGLSQVRISESQYLRYLKQAVDGGLGEPHDAAELGTSVFLGELPDSNIHTAIVYLEAAVRNGHSAASTQLASARQVRDQRREAEQAKIRAEREIADASRRARRVREEFEAGQRAAREQLEWEYEEYAYELEERYSEPERSTVGAIGETVLREMDGLVRTAQEIAEIERKVTADLDAYKRQRQSEFDREQRVLSEENRRRRERFESEQRRLEEQNQQRLRQATEQQRLAQQRALDLATEQRKIIQTRRASQNVGHVEIRTGASQRGRSTTVSESGVTGPLGILILSRNIDNKDDAPWRFSAPHSRGITFQYTLDEAFKKSEFRDHQGGKRLTYSWHLVKHVSKIKTPSGWREYRIYVSCEPLTKGHKDYRLPKWSEEHQILKNYSPQLLR